MHTLNLRLSPDEIGWIAGDAQDRFLVVDDVLLPLYQQVAKPAPVREGDRVPFSGAAVARSSTTTKRCWPTRIRTASAMPSTTRTIRWPCATRRARPAAQGRRLFAPLHHPAHAGGQPGRLLGLRGTDVVMPVTPMFHANSWGMPYGAVMMGVKLVFPARTCIPRTCWT
jgi:fatty-acyl-CoA synthase